MISVFEVNRLAGEKGISSGMIEKDYVLSKMLWSFSSLNFLRNYFVFKGGTAIRKFYFQNFRYSEDLDFSSIIVPTIEEISFSLKEAKTLLMNEFGLVLEDGKPHVVFDQSGRVAYIEFTIKYTGPLRKSSNVKSSFRLDITCDEMVINPQNTQNYLLEYSDDKEFALRVYSLTEILAEKLRSVLQRGKSRDYYDVWRILKYHQDEISPDAVKDFFKAKLRHRNIEFTFFLLFLLIKLFFLKEKFGYWCRCSFFKVSSKFRESLLGKRLGASDRQTARF
jgi:predicted nucleotidyltransferase component of viral defense system